MTVNEPLNFMPLDLDTFAGSERFMAGTRLGAAFSQGIRAYLRAAYSDAIEHFKKEGVDVHNIDAAQEPRTVHDAILKAIG